MMPCKLDALATPGIFMFVASCWEEYTVVECHPDAMQHVAVCLLAFTAAVQHPVYFTLFENSTCTSQPVVILIQQGCAVKQAVAASCGVSIERYLVTWVMQAFLINEEYCCQWCCTIRLVCSREQHGWLGSISHERMVDHEWCKSDHSCSSGCVHAQTYARTTTSGVCLFSAAPQIPDAHACLLRST